MPVFICAFALILNTIGLAGSVNHPELFRLYLLFGMVALIGFIASLYTIFSTRHKRRPLRRP